MVVRLVSKVAGKLQRVVKEEGAAAAVGLVAKNLYLPFKTRLNSRDRMHARIDKEFDDQFGTDTAGRVSVDDMDLSAVEGDEVREVYEYQGARPYVFKEILQASPVPLDGFTYIDIGSGKGRTLMLASSWAFEELIGVEIDAELTRIAEKNFEIYKNPSEQKCFNFKAVCGDASRYPLPDEDLFIIIFNSFQGSLMDNFVENLSGHLEKSKKHVIFAYVNPACKDKIDTIPNFPIVAGEEGRWLIYYRAAQTA